MLPVHQEAPGLECIAGVLADESIALLKGFYAHENPNGTFNIFLLPIATEVSNEA